MLKKGKVPVNKRVDFHGFSIEEAREKFLDTVNSCFDKNHRCILFITGKGIRKTTSSEYEEGKLYLGKIRNNFLKWLDIKEVHHKILSVQQAGVKNGGDGAFFVYLRKQKN